MPPLIGAELWLVAEEDEAPEEDGAPEEELEEAEEAEEDVEEEELLDGPVPQAAIARARVTDTIPTSRGRERKFNEHTPCASVSDSAILWPFNWIFAADRGDHGT